MQNIIMVATYGYLEKGNGKILKFHTNFSFYFEISAFSTSKCRPLIIAMSQSFDIR